MIEVILNDISLVDTDALVNSANRSLLKGSGMSYAIHNRAGIKLEEELKDYSPIEEGQAVITKGYNLLARYVIHTVAPKYYLLQENREELLRSCYLNSLILADENKIKSISFPAIGIGVYKWPIEIATNIALEEIFSYIKNRNKNIEKIQFVVRDKKLKEFYEEEINNYRKNYKNI